MIRSRCPSVRVLLREGGPSGVGRARLSVGLRLFSRALLVSKRASQLPWFLACAVAAWFTCFSICARRGEGGGLPVWWLRACWLRSRRAAAGVRGHTSPPTGWWAGYDLGWVGGCVCLLQARVAYDMREAPRGCPVLEHCAHSARRLWLASQPAERWSWPCGLCAKHCCAPPFCSSCSPSPAPSWPLTCTRDRQTVVRCSAPKHAAESLLRSTWRSRVRVAWKARKHNLISITGTLLGRLPPAHRLDDDA